jgi:ABC-type transport system involved in multi-copper enzyme maturation permease subunit
MSFPRVVATELSKLRRSRVPWVTFAGYTFMVALGGFFMWMMKNPGMAARLGLLGKKADFAFGGQPADWPAFLGFIAQMGGIGGLIICSVIAAFVFGREYTEGTAKNMLALPIPRSRFVLAKIVVSAAWFAALTLWILPVTWLAGSLLGLPGFTVDLFLATGMKLFVLALLSLCCSVLVAWVAVETRGYFAPLGFAIFTLVLGSVFGHTGWAPWVPWTIVGLYSGVAGPVATLGWGSFAVIGATFLIGTALTIRHEVAADNGQ